MTAPTVTASRPETAALQITRRVIGRRMLVVAAGEIDVATAPALVSAVDAALAAGALELWVDLTPTSFMDSSGVHALLIADRRTRELHRRLAIICPPGCPRRVLELCGMSGRVPLYHDRTAANRGS